MSRPNVGDRFPVGTALEFKGLSINFAQRNNTILSANTTVTVLDYSGSGYMTNLFYSADGSAAAYDSEFILTIDGTAHTFKVATNMTAGNQHNITAFLRFNSSLKLQIKNTHPTSSRYPSALIAYLT